MFSQLNHGVGIHFDVGFHFGDEFVYISPRLGYVGVMGRFHRSRGARCRYEFKGHFEIPFGVKGIKEVLFSCFGE